MITELSRTKVIKIKNDSFTLDISTFKVSDFITLEAEKQRLSNSKYYEMATTWFTNTLNAANLIDMIATFRTIMPSIEKGLTESYENLNILDARELLKVYMKDVSPWYQAWMKEFNTPFEDVSEE